MVEITPRQKKILFLTIEEYIKTTQPVSSLKLSQKYNFNVSSATIRNEMVKLAKKGLLFRLYSSSGGVPTDKGYLLFVEEFVKNLKPCKDLFEELEEIKKDISNLLNFSQNLARILNEFSSSLVLNYLAEKDLLWEEGWRNILLEPEFADRNCLKKFIKFVEETEKKIEDIFLREPPGSFKVFVGKENPILKCEEFGMIISRIRIPKTKKGSCLVFLGPKRMPYKKSLRAIYTLFEFLKKT
ncbi:MAG: DeoR family transcriptional regulator [Candidatus Pacebacteria bacterium]|nr:DeoR family transcriptional regulator [Candidatus Paceibacterota bacterium]